MRRVAWLAFLVCALLACKQGEPERKQKPDSKREDPTETRASASPAPATAASASAALPAEPPRQRPLAELFDGQPSGAELGKRVKGTYDGTWHVSVPEGWQANTEQYHGMVILTSPDEDARMFMSDAIGAATDKNMAFWVNGGFMHQAKIEWDKPHVIGRFGPQHRNAKLNTGKGTLFKQPAVFWAIRPDAAEHGVLIEGGVVEGASDDRKQELLAAMQSVELK
jgi:hypothetical protein